LLSMFRRFCMHLSSLALICETVCSSLRGGIVCCSRVALERLKRGGGDGWERQG
jgi:hypothetical protein